MSPAADLAALSAVELRDRIASGACTAAAAADAYLARIEAREPEIGTFAWLDPDHVRRQAAVADRHRRAGRAVGPLHGLPVAVKDVIDTAGIPTENGTPADRGRVPRRDADVVALLRAAGAVILGKTATTEMASMRPAATRNPHDAARTPGGSSAGSAAAVAAGMAPLALGTQTAGSVIRPASFCGAVGFKPTFGAIPMRGVLAQSPSLDTAGVFARDVADAALLAEAAFAHERHGVPQPHPGLLRTLREGPPLPPVLAILRPPGWEAAAPGTGAALSELREALGGQAFAFELPPIFAGAEAERRRINLAEMARCYHAHAERGGLSDDLMALIEEGRAILARDYIAARDWPDVLADALDEVFARCDAIALPAAPGPAPGRDTTGDPVFNGIWTLLGVPAVTVPVLEVDGLPLGVQLIGPRGGDARLLRTAAWLMGWVDGRHDGGEAT